MTKMTGGQAVVEVLRAEGVKFVFGLPGGHTLGFYDALYHAKDIRHILVRHEQAAANMAGAYCQLTGEAGVCSGTAGPGATNLVTGIAEAYVGALPVIAITGRGATRTTHRGASQEIPQEKIFAPITKWAVRVDRADLLVEVMRRAFTIARSGKPGPVLVDIPTDLQMQMVDFDGYVPVGQPPRARAAMEAVQAVADKLTASQRPIIVAGGGTVMSGAFSELRALAEITVMPVLTTLTGRGSLSEDHPLAAGGLGMHRTEVSRKLLAEADFVLGLGCRFEEMETNWCPGYVPAPGACYVQVDIDPEEIGKSIVPAIGVVSDIRLFLQDLMAELCERGTDANKGDIAKHPRVVDLLEQRKRVEAGVRGALESDEVPLNPLRVVREVREAFPNDITVGIDIGWLAQALAGAYPWFKVYKPRSIMACTNFYAMGFVSSALPVGKLVYPDRPTLGVCGDGTFQMIMNVLPVAAEFQLPVTWCVLNNHCLGSIRDLQKIMFEGRCTATEFEVQPDFVRIAEACGCYGERIEDPGQISAAAQRALEANERGIPAVLDYWVANTWPTAIHDYVAALAGQA